MDANQLISSSKNGLILFKRLLGFASSCSDGIVDDEMQAFHQQIKPFHRHDSLM